MYKFPLNPVLGQEHTEGQKSWEWNGIGWEIIAVPNEQVDAAKLAATQARAAVVLAEASMNNAGVSKDAAKVSELASANAKALAEAAANAARLSEVDAEAAQIVAEGAATSANTSKNVATTKASEASTSATTAETHKNAAAQSATAAAGSATTAATKATDATTQAAASLSSANTAKSHADRADAAANAVVGGQIQADFSVTDTASKAFIKNKPSIPTDNNQLTNGAGFAIQSAVTTALNGKEPTINAGAAGDYWTGAKSFAPLGAAVLSTPLVGYKVEDTGTTAADSVLTAIGKIQGQVNAREVAWKKNTSNGYAGLTGTRQVQLPNPAGNITSTLSNTNTVARNYAMPDKAGTVALMDDIAGSLRNRIINGACLVNQRGSVTTATTQTTHAGYGGPDRYSFLNANGAGAGLTVSAGSLVFNGQTKSTIRQTVNTPASTLSGGAIVGGIAQAIEGINCFDLFRKPIALSFIFNTTVSGTYNVSLRDTTGAYSYVSSFVAVANTPMKVQILIPACPVGMSIPATSGAGLALNIAAQNTGTYQASTLNTWTTTNTLTASGAVAWASVANAYIEATEVQLEEGATVTAFEQRSYGLELMLCQRYYEVVRAHIMGSAPGVGICLSTRAQYRVTKRAIPSIVVNQAYVAGLSTPVSLLHIATDGLTLYSTSTETSNFLEFVADVVVNAEL